MSDRHHRLFTSLALVAAMFAGRTAWAGEEKKDTDSSATATTGAPAVDSSQLLAALEPYIGGEWKIEAKWSDGNPLKGREIFEWGVGKKFVNCKTFVAKPDGGEYQRYETVFGVKDGKLTCWSFVFDGSADAAAWTVQGKKLSCSKPMKSARGAGPGTLHQSIELVEPNKFRWLVSYESDGKTQQLMDGHWVREASASR